MDYKALKLVSLEQMPKAQSTPIDDLLHLYKLGIYMEQICFDNKGVGLSAVQVGIPYDFFVVLNMKKNEYFFHCSYEGVGDRIKSIEGCLSIKNEFGELRRFEVERFKKIKISGKKLLISDGEPDLSVQEFEQEVSNFDAIIYQHEIDHQNGILISDFGKEIFLHRN